MVVMCRCLLPACPGGSSRLIRRVAVSGRCRVGVSRSTKRSGPAGVPAKPVASSFTSQCSCPSRGRVTPSARCEPAALMKDHVQTARRACWQTLLVNGMRYRTWSGFHTVMKQRPPQKVSIGRIPAIQLSALPHGSANDGLDVWLPEAVGPLIRASFVRTLRSRPQRILSGSRPMQQRLVCVEAGQTFPIQRIEVLTPQVSSIHCRLTQGRSVAL